MDASSRPLRCHRSLTAAQEKELLELRTTKKLSLDELLDAGATIAPNLTRSSLYRTLVRNGLQRLAKPERAPHQCYDDRDRKPGFVHIDSFMLTCLREQGRAHSKRKHCFVAVDRATRAVFMRVYDNHNGKTACDFLARCQKFFPFRIHTILTDNGGEYTLKGVAPAAYAKGKRTDFEAACDASGIVYKTTRPYTPKTNGLVERVNGLVQQQTIKRHRYETQEQVDQALTDWLNNYNLKRKHSRIPIGRMTPLDALCLWFNKEPDIFHRRPDPLHLQSKICSQPTET
jgi:transposase InsO family protein